MPIKAPHVVVLLLALASPALAEVNEQLDYEYYAADADAYETVREALAAATPIRSGGKIFHGYTRWHINWRFRWKQADGECYITRVDTRLTSTITLPELEGGTAKQREAFDRYLEALEEHELGHYAFGQEAAETIDAEMADMDALRSCKALEAAANELAQGILADYVKDEKRYDIDTDHGRTQGARLRE
ncbi:MAG: DUF922 domain-containing protein [Pseudomonadota bacterium]